MDNPNSGSNHIRDYVERYKKLLSQAQDVRDDIKELGIEAKGNGFDPAALKEIAKREEEDVSKAEKRKEREVILDTYRSALGIEW